MLPAALLLPLVHADLSTAWSMSTSTGWPLSNQWTYDTPVSLGKWKAKVAVEYDYNVLPKSPKTVSLAGSVPGAEDIDLSYKAARDFAGKKSSLNLKSVISSVGLTANFAGKRFPNELTKLTASKTVVAAGVKVLVEPSFASKAKEAALKLVAKKGPAAVTMDIAHSGVATYSVRSRHPPLPRRRRCRPRASACLPTMPPRPS